MHEENIGIFIKEVVDDSCSLHNCWLKDIVLQALFIKNGDLVQLCLCYLTVRDIKNKGDNLREDVSLMLNIAPENRKDKYRYFRVRLVIFHCHLGIN